LEEAQAYLDTKTEELDAAKQTYTFFREKFLAAKAQVKEMKKRRAPPHKVTQNTKQNHKHGRKQTRHHPR